MGCIVEFNELSLQCEFNNEGKRQQILVDMLLKYGELDIACLASVLTSSINELQDIRDGKHFFTGEQANDLSYLFLSFFGRTFFKKFTLIRNFFDKVDTNKLN